jgi:ribosomal protein S18 acetylase RimI-like enzyme
MPEPGTTAPRAWVAEPHEAEAVARLIGAFRDYYGREKPSDNAILAAVERLIETPDTEYLLAAPDDDSPPLGIIQLRFRFSVWTSAPDCWLEDLFVDARARRRGVAEALMELAFARARERGVRRIELDTWESNEPALALYRRHGFTDRSKGNDGRDLLLGAKLGEHG